MMDAFIPLGEWITIIVEFTIEHFSLAFDVFSSGVSFLADSFESLLLLVPFWLLIIILVGIAFWRVGKRFAVFVFLGLGLIVGIGLWEESMSTLALVLSATFISLIVGIPVGIWSAKSNRAEMIIRPTLDFMQTMPAFVYLIPAAMLFGLGKVPGMMATIIFSLPASVRLTSLGIRQVPRETVESGVAFGCTSFQLLTKVEIPIAMPTIMAGINQTIMLSLSMVVIASMIGAGGLGNEVLKGIQRLDIGLGFEGGMGVVILAIILDRITQSVRSGGKKKARLQKNK